MTTRVDGFCPLGCGQTLTLGFDGRVACEAAACPRPFAASVILADAETGHLVTFGRDVFTIRHPLRERLDDALMTCDLHQYCHDLPGPPVPPGRYRAHSHGDGWSWEALS